MKLLAVVLLSFFLQIISAQTIKSQDLNVTLTKTECGSYEVKKNDGKLLGYIVKPMYMKIEKKEVCISKFEESAKTNHHNYYDDYYRVYWFMKDRASDTLMLVIMLPPKKLSLVPNWQCEEQSIDVYNRLYKIKHRSRYSFFYNCSKGRLKVLGDPD